MLSNFNNKCTLYSGIIVASLLTVGYLYTYCPKYYRKYCDCDCCKCTECNCNKQKQDGVDAFTS